MQSIKEWSNNPNESRQMQLLVWVQNYRGETFTSYPIDDFDALEREARMLHDRGPVNLGEGAAGFERSCAFLKNSAYARTKDIMEKRSDLRFRRQH